jgi:hypothetical protein
MSFVSNSGKFKIYTVLNGLIFPTPTQPRISFERAIVLSGTIKIMNYAVQQRLRLLNELEISMYKYFSVLSQASLDGPKVFKKYFVHFTEPGFLPNKRSENEIGIFKDRTRTKSSPFNILTVAHQTAILKPTLTLERKIRFSVFASRTLRFFTLCYSPSFPSANTLDHNCSARSKNSFISHKRTRD